MRPFWIIVDRANGRNAMINTDHIVSIQEELNGTAVVHVTQGPPICTSTAYQEFVDKISENWART